MIVIYEKRNGVSIFNKSVRARKSKSCSAWVIRRPFQTFCRQLFFGRMRQLSCSSVIVDSVTSATKKSALQKRGRFDEKYSARFAILVCFVVRSVFFLFCKGECEMATLMRMSKQWRKPVFSLRLATGGAENRTKRIRRSGFSQLRECKRKANVFTKRKRNKSS